MNILRQFKNERNAAADRRTVALENAAREITAVFANGDETVDFVFDSSAFCAVGSPALPQGTRDLFVRAFGPDSHLLDDWGRGVLPLKKSHAVAFAQLVEEWNGEWKYARSRDMRDYNAYRIDFRPATGKEHVVSVGTGGRHTTDSWQWQ